MEYNQEFSKIDYTGEYVSFIRPYGQISARIGGAIRIRVGDRVYILLGRKIVDHFSRNIKNGI